MPRKIVSVIYPKQVGSSQLLNHVGPVFRNRSVHYKMQKVVLTCKAMIMNKNLIMLSMFLAIYITFDIYFYNMFFG